jgi:hypothetical protein
MHSPASRQGWDYFLHVTKSFRHNRHTSISTETRGGALFVVGPGPPPPPGARGGGGAPDELSVCMPTAFQWQWPNDIRSQIVSFENPTGTITNSNLEMAGLLLLWLTVEGVCGLLQEKRVAIFGDNSPLIGWVTRLASKWSLVAKHLIQALALWLKIQRTCPLTTIHIKGKQNTISDVLFGLFGSNPTWKCATSDELLTLFNPMFPLPNQTSWTVFHLNGEVVTRGQSLLLWTIGGGCPG